MQRRKLTAFTIAYMAGITAGFFMLERSRPAEAVCFAAACFISLYISGELLGNSGYRAALALIIIAGVLMFSLRFYIYEDFEEAVIAENSTDTETVLCGTVKKVTVSEETIRLTVSPAGKMPGSPDAYMTLRGYEGNAYDLIGCVIRSHGEYKRLEGADNPGCFDNRLYRRCKGTGISFSGSEPEVINEGTGILMHFKRRLISQREKFIGLFDEDIRGFIRGVIFGDKSGMDEDLKNEFNINQTGHILAVSGLHMGFLYSLLRTLSGRKRTKLAAAAIILIMIGYGEMTLWSPATVRACLVIAVSLLSVHVRRPADLLSSISLSALILLTYQPYQLFDTGFQMSFLAMGGIAFLSKPLSLKLGEGAGTMAAVQLGIVPVAAYTYYRTNPLSVFINIPVVLLSSVLVPVCIMLIFIQIFVGAAPASGIWIVQLIARSIIRINHLLTFGGNFSIPVAGLGSVAVITFYVVCFGAASEWTRIKLVRREHRDIAKAAICVFIPVAMLSSCCFDRFSDDEVVFVSVGQGDCTHIRAAGHDVLIDGGGQAGYGDDEKGYNIGEKVLMPYLLHSGAGCVDAAFVTHLHTDHYKGIKELAEVYPVSALGIPVDYRENDLSDIAGDTDIFYVSPDTKADIAGDVCIDVLWPVKVSREPVAADDANEHNTVYMIHYKGTKIMVTGDLLEEDEHEMVDYYRKKHNIEALHCDILKVAHHGSKSSSCDEFLDAASPSVAVISVGKNNLYGHPHAETIEKLEERGIKVFRTDQSGAVGIDIRRNGIKIDLLGSQ